MAQGSDGVLVSSYLINRSLSITPMDNAENITRGPGDIKGAKLQALLAVIMILKYMRFRPGAAGRWMDRPAACYSSILQESHTDHQHRSQIRPESWQIRLYRRQGFVPVPCG